MTRLKCFHPELTEEIIFFVFSNVYFVVTVLLLFNCNNQKLREALLVNKAGRSSESVPLE